MADSHFAVSSEDVPQNLQEKGSNANTHTQKKENKAGHLMLFGSNFDEYTIN